MHTSYEYVDWANHSYFKGNYWKNPVVKGARIYASKNPEVNIHQQ